MTGLVKEEILTRQAELGYFIENGNLLFDFLMLDRSEFLAAPTVFNYFDIDGQLQQIDLEAGSLAYSICQIPVILRSSKEDRVTVYFTNGSAQQVKGHVLDYVNSGHIFIRDGVIHHLIVSIS